MDEPGVEIEIHTNQPEARVAKTIMKTGDNRYAALSYIEVKEGADSIPELFSEGPEQAEFNGHLVSFMQDNDWFAGSCVRCGRRYQIRLTELTDADDEQVAALKGYIIGYFIERDCEHDAIDAARDVMRSYVGQMDTPGNRHAMQREVNETITDFAETYGRIESYG